MASITLDELHAYHALDREVFSKMVIRLFRDPAESLLIMALWLWMEERGYPNIIMKLPRISDVLVNAIADEASLCLKVLEANTLPILPHGGIPLTARVMERNISLEMFYHNKFSAITGVKIFLNSVCSRIFTDILQIALGKKNSGATQPLVIPGFPHPVFGSVNIVPRAINFDISVGGLWGWDPSEGIAEDDKTMFLTFSRGFPVTKEEVANLFTRLHGEACVVDVHMQENVPENEQPLFARMVLDSIGSVDRILNGKRIAKFRINGKHIWARKYERRE
ncbi:hypothetical protein M5689_011834 [Euphorbia peplus]|nr:hypothetical protein M5689_011834 [Euphorbia peplus]